MTTPEPQTPAEATSPAPAPEPVGVIAWLKEDLRECPATWTLAASWVVVFALMQAVQWSSGTPRPSNVMADPLTVSSMVGHEFGDMTWAEVMRGEVWRLLTATFVHFGLFHVALNVFGLIKLGQLVEPWYGSGPFLAGSLVVGAAGNFVGGLMRYGVDRFRTWADASGWLGALPGFVDRFFREGSIPLGRVPSGGGSTILLGLLGLVAVVGWRSNTRIGAFLRDQMLTMLAVTAALGLLLINLIDNYGHAGGAIVGALVGLAHRPMFRLGERSRGFRLGGWLVAAGLTAACLALAVADDRAESRLRRSIAELRARQEVDNRLAHELVRFVGSLGRIVTMGPSFRDPASALDASALIDTLSKGPVRPDLNLAALPPEVEARVRRSVLAELASSTEALAEVDRDGQSAGRPGDLGRLVDLGRSSTVDPPRFRQVYEAVSIVRDLFHAIELDAARVRADLLAIERKVE